MTIPSANSSGSYREKNGEQHTRLGGAAQRDLSSLMAFICQTATRSWMEKHLLHKMEGQGLHLDCGNGEDTLLIASLLSENSTLLGMDEEEVMIEAARQKKALSGLGNVQFTQAGPFDLNPAFSFDFIYTRRQTTAPSDLAGWTAALAGSLKTGGMLLLEIISPSGFHAFPYNHAFARAMELIGRLEEARPNEAEQLTALLKKAGFTDMETAYAPPAFIPRTCNRIASLSLECYQSEILRRSDSNRAELNALLQELRAFEQQADTLISRPGVLQIAARKNEPSK